MQEYSKGTWHVSGVFDLMGAFFGDGESDLSRMTAMYIDEDIRLARMFVQAYLNKKPPRPSFAERFPIYMLDDRLILWDYFQRHSLRWWDEQWTFRDWAERYIVPDTLL